MSDEIILDFTVTTYFNAVINDEEIREALEDCEPMVWKGYNDLGELAFIEIDLCVMKDEEVLSKLKDRLKESSLTPSDIRRFIALVKYLGTKEYHTLQVYD